MTGKWYFILFGQVWMDVIIQTQTLSTAVGDSGQIDYKFPTAIVTKLMYLQVDEFRPRKLYEDFEGFVSR